MAAGKSYQRLVILERPAPVLIPMHVLQKSIVRRFGIRSIVMQGGLTIPPEHLHGENGTPSVAEDRTYYFQRGFNMPLITMLFAEIDHILRGQHCHPLLERNSLPAFHIHNLPDI